MIRVNLLPRPNETMRLGSIELDANVLRQLVIGIAVVVAVGLLGMGIELLRVHRLGAAVAEEEAAVALRAPERERSRQLMFEVARFQEFEREARHFRRTGGTAALGIARIGNGVPRSVWLTEINSTADGYTVGGGSHSLDQIGATILALGESAPSGRASLVSIDNRDAAGTGLRFTAQIWTPNRPREVGP